MITLLYHNGLNTQWVNTIIGYAIDAVPLVALFGVIIALFTLREMQRQRQKAYEPQLFLSNLTVWMQKNENGTPFILKSDWKRQNGLNSLPFFNLEMHNIGLGAANTIAIIWQYDRKGFIEKFKTLASKTKLLKVKDDGYFEYLFKEESDSGYGFSIETTEDSKEELSFLTSDQTSSIRMPQALYNYLTFIPYLELVKQNLPRRIDMTKEICVIKFVYYDIGGKRHRQKIRMYIELYAYSKEFPENNYALASISFKK